MTDDDCTRCNLASPSGCLSLAYCRHRDDGRRFSIEEVARFFNIPAEALRAPDPFIEMRKLIEAEQRRSVERFFGIGEFYLERMPK